MRWICLSVVLSLPLLAGCASGDDETEAIRAAVAVRAAYAAIGPADAAPDLFEGKEKGEPAGDVSAETPPPKEELKPAPPAAPPVRVYYPPRRRGWFR